MKKQLIIAAAITAVLAGCKQEKEPETVALDTEDQRAAYGMGISLGMRLKQEPMDIDVAAFTAGIAHAMTDVEPLMTEEEISQSLQAFQQKQITRQQEAMTQLAEKNKIEGEAFLAENAGKEGVVTTESGLQYKVITEGSGDKPTADDTVEVHYRGTLLDGTEFDSSYKRNSTVSFPVGGVIPGWTEALQLMPVGSKWELYIPSDLAYGPGGTGGGPIGPNATLIFEVELIGIKNVEAESQEDGEG